MHILFYCYATADWPTIGIPFGVPMTHPLIAIGELQVLGINEPQSNLHGGWQGNELNWRVQKLDANCILNP